MAISYAPGQSSTLGPIVTQPLIGIQLLMSIKLNIDIHIVLVITTKSLFKNKNKKHAEHNIHKLVWGPMLVPPGNCPAYPCVKTVL